MLDIQQYFNPRRHENKAVIPVPKDSRAMLLTLMKYIIYLIRSQIIRNNFPNTNSQNVDPF